MTPLLRLRSHRILFASTRLMLVVDAVWFLWLCVRPPTTLATENLFLRKQLALSQERNGKPRRAHNAARLTLVCLGRWFNWCQAFVIVQPATFTRWHRQGLRLFWRWQSTPGRPPIPVDLQAFIRRMARENPSWGAARIANELLLTLGIRVSPRTICTYLPKRLHPGRGKRATTPRWRTFMCSHAQAIVVCDFCVVVTAAFRLLYVCVFMEHATRRILHVNVTALSTASWTLQQLRAAIPADHDSRFLLQDHDRIFSAQCDRSRQPLGLRVLKTPPQSPQAHAFCERLLGTLRRECVDDLLPLFANPVGRVLTQWVRHDNVGGPHMALGPGIPQPHTALPASLQEQRHRLPTHGRVVARPILGGLHQAYRLEEPVA